MSFGQRTEIAETVREQLLTEMDADASLEVRIIETDSRTDGTNLIGALEGLMADVPRDRIAGAVLITDGQVHDVPEDMARLGELGPVHALITGDPDSGDRRISLVQSPDFGIVGEEAQFLVRVDDPVSQTATVTVSVNGGLPRRMTVATGEDTPLPIEIERRGDNIVVVETPAGEQELTLANNRTAATLSGVRDRLRVLLITGKPNAAGRVWRDRKPAAFAPREDAAPASIDQEAEQAAREAVAQECRKQRGLAGFVLVPCGAERVARERLRRAARLCRRRDGACAPSQRRGAGRCFGRGHRGVERLGRGI